MKTVYAIPNCNTVKKALDFLKANKIDYEFHDYKKKGITAKHLTDWSKQIGWASLINKKGSTWKQLPKEIQETITNQKAAIELMMEKTSIIKRPLIEENGKVLALGFDDTDYQKIFSK